MRCSAPMFEAKIEEPMRNQPALRLARKKSVVSFSFCNAAQMQMAVLTTKYRPTMAQSSVPKDTAVPVMNTPHKIVVRLAGLAGKQRFHVGRRTALHRSAVNRSTAQDPQELFQFHAHLLDDLLALAHVDAGFFPRELVA